MLSGPIAVENISCNIHRLLFITLCSTTQSLQIASSQGQNAFSYAPEIQKGINAASRAVALLKIEPKLRDPEQPAVEQFVSKLYTTFDVMR